MNRRSARTPYASKLFAAILLLLSPLGQAQVAPLASVGQPGSGPADGAEPWAVVQNPAALAGARGWLLGLRHTELAADSGLAFLGSAAGRGSGLYVAGPMPYLSRFAIGGGLEILRPGAAPLPELTGKLTLALAYRLFPQLTLGLSYGHLFASKAAPSYDGLNTFGMSARLTAGRFLAAGLVLHDLPAPRPADPAAPGVERSYELELLTRPVGDRRFELAAGVRVGEESHILWPRLRLWARPLPGLGIGIDGMLAARFERADPMPSGLDYRVGIGLELDFAHVGASGFLSFGGSGGSAPSTVALAGGSAALRLSFESYPALWRGPDRVYKIELGNSSSESLLRLFAALRALERDPRARGVVVLANGFGGGWGVADEMRQSLSRLRAAGKRVVVYGADLSQRELYIASAAERIYLDPIGSVHMAGISQSNFYVKESIERLGVRADLLRVGAYKSAPEMWTRSEPSEPARAQRQALVDDLFERLCESVASGRRLPRQKVAELVERGLFSARAAVEAGLVDGIATGEQVEEHLSTLLGEAVRITALERPVEHPASYAPPGVAVVLVEGDLTSGRSHRLPIVNLRVAGAETLLETLASLEADPQIRAVVLRVDSPGGSALAADLLARQVIELSQKKPVVCSFGDVAASGGYYLSAPCSVLFTNPSTTTGSIGIFGGKVDASGLLSWLGVRRVSLQRGSHADQESPFRPYTDAERALVLARLRQGYDRFVEIVMKGRHLSAEEVEARAAGRVWSGSQAVSQRLCDRTGGLMDAVAEARKRAGLAPEGSSPIFYYPRQPANLLSSLLGLPSDLFGAAAAAEQSSVERLLSSALELLPGLKAALLLLDSEVLMRLDTDPPR